MKISLKYVRIFAFLIAIATLIPVAGGAPAVAAAPSPWDAPKPSSLSEQQVQQFVDLWSPRFQNQSFLESYLKSEVVPEDIKNEGFHGLNGDEKRYLVARLYDRLSTQMADLAVEAAAARANGDTAFLDQQRTVLFMFVFEKSWISDLKEKNKPPKADGTAKFDTSPELLQAIDQMSRQLIQTPAAPQLPGGVVNATTVDVGAQVRDQIKSMISQVEQPPLPPSQSSTTPLGIGVYQLCFQPLAGAYTCSADTPWGVPVEMGGVRGTMSLPIINPLNLNTIGVSFTAEKVNPAATIPAYVAGRIDLFMVNKRIEVGFSSPTNLAARSTVTATLNDIAQAVAGNVDMTAAITHVSPGASNALEARVGNINYGGSLTNPPESDRTLATIGFAPVPTSLTANLKLNRLPTQDDYTVTINSSTSSVVTPDIRIESGAAPGALKRRITAIVSPLPTSIKLHFGLLATGQVNVDYDASSTTDISFVDTQYAGGQPTRQISGVVDDLPKKVGAQFVPTPLRIVYTADTAVPLISAVMTTYSGGTPSVAYYGYARGVPTQVTLDGANMPASFSYTTSTSIPEIGAAMVKPPTGESAFAIVKGLPTSATVSVDVAQQKLSWVASGATTQLFAGATIVGGGRTWNAYLDVKSIPAQWDASFASGHPVFRGISGPIGEVFGYLTNHGTTSVFGGNFAHVAYNAGSGDLDAAFRMIQINLADIVQTTSGFTADLRMGGAQPLYINANIIDGAKKLILQSSLSPLPTSIQLSHTGQDFTYNADANFTLSAYGEFGNAGGIANAPSPPLIIGASLRDGNGCVGAVCGNGFKARILVYGFPKSIVATPAASTGPKIVITGFNPPAAYNYLGLDIDLDNVVSPRTKLSATQYGIPANVNFTFGPMFTETLGDGSKKTTLKYSASAGLGPLYAQFERGTDVGFAYVSNIPSSIDISANITSGTSTVTINNSAVITQIQVLFRRTSDISFQAGVSLTDIPASISLSFGRITVTSGSDSFTVPGFTYSASGSTLDIFAFVNATLFGGNVQAALTFLTTNLGAASKAFLQSGNQLKVTSSPATSNIEIHTWGRINYLRNFSGCLPSSCGTFRLEYSGHGGVVPLDINDLALQVTNVSDLTVTLGITSAIQGTYGTFRFGWNSITAAIDFAATVKACVSSFCLTIVSVHIHQTITVNILFHMGTNHSALWYHISTPIPCSFTSAYDVHVDLRPHPHFAQFNGFTVSAASAEGGGWTVTPNPGGVLPSFAMEVVAGYTSPMGGGLSVSFPCH